MFTEENNRTMVTKYLSHVYLYDIMVTKPLAMKEERRIKQRGQ